MRLLIHERDENGILHRLLIWVNFLKSVPVQGRRARAAAELKERYDAKVIITSMAEDDYVEFETEQDMLMFMLKWS